MKVWINRIFLVLFSGFIVCAGIIAYADIVTAPFIYSATETPPHAEVALVLGASVSSSGKLSAVMAERADKAVQLYKAKTVEKILVTGDNSTLSYDEVYPVGKYLLIQGVPEEDIFLDYAGFDTYSSMYRAREVFDVTSVVVVSQAFHLRRAVFIARSLGLDATGIDASRGERYVWYTMREIPASIKAVLDLWSKRVPKYLGVQFPVGGDGSTTWVGSSAQMIYFQNQN
ncbi:MAG: YdcF family protein [Candidatus Adlerbacteria bacterium]|nr:YdcF family protein [Candidatus Adlerbacteria bacterium]